MKTTISVQEKDSICSILDEIEADYTPSFSSKTYSKLQEIDNNCKQLWPSWNGPFYIPNTYTDKDTKECKSSSISDENIEKNDSFPNEIPNESNCSSNSFSNENDQIKQLTTTKNPEAQQLADEVDELKEKVTHIMKKLSLTVSSVDEIPPLTDADPFIACEIDENATPHRPKRKYFSKEEERKKIIAVQRKIMAVKQDNKKLEDELVELKKQYVSSQMRIARLRKEVRRSTIILNDMKKKEEKRQAELETQTDLNMLT